MSNPRRFGKVTLYRVTRAMPLDKAKRKAAAIRKSGIRARVDSYQGRYAVWSVKSAGKDYAEELRLRKRLGHICGTCEHFAANTKFKKWGGKDIVPNQCMQGRRRTTDLPFMVSPDSPCILSFDLWRRSKRLKKSKMITIYHGTSSDNIKEIAASGYVVGYWTTDIQGSQLFGLAYCMEYPYHVRHPIILEAKVPLSLIVESDDIRTQIHGFKPESSARYKQFFKQRRTKDILSKKYIVAVHHFKLHDKNGMNLHTDYAIGGFKRKDWVRRVGLTDISILQSKKGSYFVSGRMQLLVKTQIKVIVAKQNRVYIEETGEPMADKYQKALSKVLSVMPIIPKGRNVGSMDWHNCEGNAIAHFKSTGDIAFIGFLITGYKEPLRHAFNIKDGKVLEMTGGIKWTKNKQYVGVPIPPKEMAGYKYQRKDWNVQWLKAQRAEISFR